MRGEGIDCAISTAAVRRGRSHPELTEKLSLPATKAACDAARQNALINVHMVESELPTSRPAGNKRSVVSELTEA